MPDQAPAFQFYAKDWLASSAVRRMTLSERGAYIDLLAHAWNEGSIPNDAESLSSMLGVSKRVWKTVARRVLARFTDRGDGTLVNEKQEGVRAQLLACKEGQSKAGKAGAEKRWGRHDSAIGVASGVATVSPLAKNSSASATTVRTDPPLTPPQAEGNGKKAAKRRQRHQIVAGLDPGGQCQICGEHRPKPNGFCRGTTANAETGVGG